MAEIAAPEWLERGEIDARSARLIGESIEALRPIVVVGACEAARRRFLTWLTGLWPAGFPGVVIDPAGGQRREDFPAKPAIMSFDHEEASVFSALRVALRMDPAGIVVFDCPPEQWSLVAQAALTGHQMIFDIACDSLAEGRERLAAELGSIADALTAVLWIELNSDGRGGVGIAAMRRPQ